jgi:O-antigen/teichoic acid export membrane protein
MLKTDIASVTRNASYILATRGMTGVVRAIYAVVLARYLGPEIYGLFNYGQSWYLALLPISALGLDAYISREVGRDRSRAGTVLSLTLGWRTAAALLVAGFSAVLAFLIEPDQYLQGLLLVFSFALFGRGVAQWNQEVFTAFQQSHLAFHQDLRFRPLELGLAILVLIADGGLYGLALAHAVVWWLQGIHGLRVIRREIWPVKPDWALRRNLHVLLSAAPLGLSALFFAWLLQGPLVIYRHVQADTNVLGQVALVLQIFLVLSWLPLAFSKAALPILSRIAAESNQNTPQNFLSAVLSLSVLLTGLGAMISWGVGDVLVAQIFGGKFAQAGTLLGFGVLLLLPWSISSALWSAQVASGKAIHSVSWTFLGALSMSLMLPVMSNSLGPQGVIASAFCGMSVCTAGLMWLSRKNLRGLWIQHLAKPLLAILAGALVQYYWGWWQAGSLIAGIIITVLSAFGLKILSIAAIKQRTNLD